MKKNLILKILFLFTFIIITTNYSNASSDFTYKLDSNNIATITSYKGTNGNITIPSTIDGYKVTSISNHAFNESRNDTNGLFLTNVTISEGITTIGDFAFVGCKNLESIKLPESLTDLGFQTFIGCSKLKNVNIPNNLKEIGPYLFQETGLTEFTIPENINSIGSCTFRLCKKLQNVKVYSKNLSYSDNIFEYCSDNLILYGYEGSTTEIYALNNGIIFIPLKEETNNNIKDIQATSIFLDRSSLMLNEGDSIILSVRLSSNELVDNGIIWYSSNPSVATVENGIITAINAGSATITASISNTNLETQCPVLVLKNSSEETESVTEIENDNDNDNDNDNNISIILSKYKNYIYLAILIILVIFVLVIYNICNKSKQIRL